MTLYEQENFYVDLCTRYGEDVCIDDYGLVDCFSDHAKKLRDRYALENQDDY